MKKSFLSTLLVVSMVGSMVMGCGKAETPAPSTAPQETKAQESGETSAAAETQAQGGEEISGELNLAIFQGGYGAEYWEILIEKFKEKYPNVTVTAEINPKIGEMIRPRIIAGDVPDFISLNYQGEPSGLITGLVKDHALMDLTDLFEEIALDRDEKLKDIILPGILDSKLHSPYGDGKIYMAPFSTSPTGLIYNKALFEEKGWESPATWDEFFALNEVAKADGRSLYTFPGLYPGYSNSMFLPALANHIGHENLEKIFNYEPGSFSTPEVKAVLEQFARLGKEGLMSGSLGMNHTQSQSEMMLGKSLFISNGTWIENEMKDAPRENETTFTFAMNPSLKMSAEESMNIMVSVEQLSIPVNAKNPEAAKEFIKFIYSEESVKLFGEKASGLIAVKGGVEMIKDSITPSMYNMLSVLEQEDVNLFPQGYKVLPANSKFNVIDVFFAKGLLPLYNGELTVDEYCERVEKVFTEIQEEYKKAEQ